MLFCIEAVIEFPRKVKGFYSAIFVMTSKIFLTIWKQSLLFFLDFFVLLSSLPLDICPLRPIMVSFNLVKQCFVVVKQYFLCKIFCSSLGTSFNYRSIFPRRGLVAGYLGLRTSDFILGKHTYLLYSHVMVCFNGEGLVEPSLLSMRIIECRILILAF